jgi:hypothetical protein
MAMNKCEFAIWVETAPDRGHYVQCEGEPVGQVDIGISSTAWRKACAEHIKDRMPDKVKRD